MPTHRARPENLSPSATHGEPDGCGLGGLAARDHPAALPDRGGAADGGGDGVLGGEAAAQLPLEHGRPALDVAEPGLGALEVRGEPAAADADGRLGPERRDPRLADPAALALAVEAH